MTRSAYIPYNASLSSIIEKVYQPPFYSIIYENGALRPMLRRVNQIPETDKFVRVIPESECHR
jgi:hypothetical protein